MAATLNDQAILGQDAGLMQRVRTAIISAAIAISNDGLTGGINTLRHDLSTRVINNPGGLKALFAAAIATDASVIADATAGGTVALTVANAAAQAAQVTDTHINNAVSAMWNAFFVH